MAKVNQQLALREDPPKPRFIILGVAPDGYEFAYTLKANEFECPRCEGTGRDNPYDYLCPKCRGDRIIIETEGEE